MKSFWSAKCHGTSILEFFVSQCITQLNGPSLQLPSEEKYIQPEAENMSDRLEMICNLKMYAQMSSKLTLNNVYEDLRIKFTIWPVYEKINLIGKNAFGETQLRNQRR